MLHACDAGPVVPGEVLADTWIVPLVGEVEMRPEREHLAYRNVGAAPGGGRPQRSEETGFPRDALQLENVIRLVIQLIFELDADYGSMLPAQSRCLPANMAKPGADRVQVVRIISPLGVRGVDYPVRMPAVAHLTVAPRAQAQDDLQPQLVAQVNEGREVQVALEAGMGLLVLLVVNPEDIGCNHVDAAALHQP